MTGSLKTILFIDAQNTYQGARTSFFNASAPSASGQFDPAKLGDLIVSRGGPQGLNCHLAEVRAYTGRPDPRKDPKTYVAHMRQCAKWEADGVTVIHRGLRYPPDWAEQKAQEKGIDTVLAIDFVTMAVDGVYDIGVIMSTDTDLLPALEFVCRRFAGRRYAAVAAWHGHQSNRRLSVSEFRVWCHWLNRDDYGRVADPTDYSR